MRFSDLGHLARRWVIAVVAGGPTAAQEHWVRAQLTDAHWGLWQQMSPQDRRHAVMVARRFLRERPGASRAELVAALLHDVGKVHSGLGTTQRVIATMVAGRTRGRWHRGDLYGAHEQLSLDMIRAAGCDPVTLAVLRGEHPAAEALARADRI